MLQVKMPRRLRKKRVKRIHSQTVTQVVNVHFTKPPLKETSTNHFIRHGGDPFASSRESNLLANLTHLVTKSTERNTKEDTKEDTKVNTHSIEKKKKEEEPVVIPHPFNASAQGGVLGTLPQSQRQIERGDLRRRLLKEIEEDDKHRKDKGR